MSVLLHVLPVFGMDRRRSPPAFPGDTLKKAPTGGRFNPLIPIRL